MWYAKAETMPPAVLFDALQGRLSEVPYLGMAKKKVATNTKGARTPVKLAPKPGAGRVNVVRVPKPWGHETIWARSDRYVGKILHINAGQELSVQYHNRKDETVYLLSGEISYRVQSKGDVLDDVQLKVGESFRITPGTIHQMVALTDCDVLEVSTPELDDVVRLSDKYGREGTSAP
jgi:mannose-6-phosphate isomerase-like protein (cupin superfamily)